MFKKLNNILKNVDIKFYLFERLTFFIGIFSINLNKFFYPNSFKIGKNYKLWGVLRLLIDGNGKISIGNNFHGVSSSIRSYITLFSNCRLTSIRGGIIKIGDDVGINGTTIVAKKIIEIGKNTIIAPKDEPSLIQVFFSTFLSLAWISSSDIFFKSMFFKSILKFITMF